MATLPPASERRPTRLADKNFALLKADPRYPSLPFKKVGDQKQLWSVRVGLHYRALGRDKPEGVYGFGLELTGSMTGYFLDKTANYLQVVTL